MTRQVALFVAAAHALDAATLLAVLPLSSMAGEYGLGASLVYPLTPRGRCESSRWRLDVLQTSYAILALT